MDLDVEMLREEDRHAAPAATDVEYALPVGQCQLGGDMGELGVLRLGEGLDPVRPVGAAVLHVLGVEHQAVEVVADVVVMRDVPARADAVVDRADGEAGTVADATAERGWAQLAAPLPSGWSGAAGRAP